MPIDLVWLGAIGWILLVVGIAAMVAGADWGAIPAALGLVVLLVVEVLGD